MVDAMFSFPLQEVAAVVIGRNEDERLALSLRSVLNRAGTVIYVDSGSTDGSVQLARSLGCTVVELEPPFSAARARNEGFERVASLIPEPTYVQFLDGDCELLDGWLEQGIATLQSRPDVGVVAGQVREAHPEASLYNRLCDLEWRVPAGEVLAVSGRFLVRSEVFRAVGGFRPNVIAAEDDELCLRVRHLGARILVLDLPMALHDAAMRSFGQWWRRSRRAGHGYAQVNSMHGADGYFARDLRRLWLWALVLPAMALVAAPFTGALSLAVLAGLYALQFARIFVGGLGRRWGAGESLLYAFFTVLFKFPALLGVFDFRNRRKGEPPQLIEYKGRSQR